MPYLIDGHNLIGQLPGAAFRGFGAPQSIFALERHMDRVSTALGIAPDELRRRNFIRPGQVSAVGQTISIATTLIDQDLDETRVEVTKMPASATFDAITQTSH